MAPTASTATQANQQPCVPPSFSEYAASVYGSEEAADCRLRFYVSQAHTEQEQSGQADPGAGSSGTATAAQLQQPSRTFVGEPLPAHSLILRGTSLRLRALLSRWTDEDDQPRSGGSLPELHVLLDAAEDLGPASEVVRFCYTGQLTELDFHALLLVRRQASYLQVCLSLQLGRTVVTVCMLGRGPRPGCANAFVLSGPCLDAGCSPVDTSSLPAL